MAYISKTTGQLQNPLYFSNLLGEQVSLNIFSIKWSPLITKI